MVGKKYLDLVNLVSNGAIEHDIFWSHRDIDQKEGNNNIQKDLFRKMLELFSDGDFIITTDNLCKFIESASKSNAQTKSKLVCGSAEH